MPAKLPLDEGLLRELHAQDVTNDEMARRLGCHSATIERRCRKLGLRKERTGPKNGERHPNWQGGEKIVGRYRYIYMPEHPHATQSKYVLEHRLVMEQKLGRLLRPKEVVHHLDGNPLNNAPKNLQVFASNGEHLVEHLAGSREHGQRIAEGMKRSEKWAKIRAKSKFCVR